INLVQTTVSENAGIFNIVLPCVRGHWDPSLGWELSFDSSLSQSHVNVNRGGNFFNTVIQENDLVYIRFERLTTSRDGQIYDMIGLVDRVMTRTNSNNIDVVVTGRDMMKVFIDDGSYFFVTQFAQNIFTDDQSILSKRNRAELEATSFAAIGYTFKPIDTILKFIYNKFSNIGWVP